MSIYFLLLCLYLCIRNFSHKNKSPVCENILLMFLTRFLSYHPSQNISCQVIVDAYAECLSLWIRPEMKGHTHGKDMGCTPARGTSCGVVCSGEGRRTPRVPGMDMEAARSPSLPPRCQWTPMTLRHFRKGRRSGPRPPGSACRPPEQVRRGWLQPGPATGLVLSPHRWSWRQNGGWQSNPADGNVTHMSTLHRKRHWLILIGVFYWEFPNITSSTKTFFLPMNTKGGFRQIVRNVGLILT